ncbi:MAG: glycosyltransferase, partial [Patescibacteria group bacterium]
LKASLKLQVKSLKLEDKVFFEGYQKDLHKYYEEADAFLLTSDAEGWGRVVLEAAAHGMPIIMTNVGLAQEIIKNDESGFIIPVGDERELVLAMQEFIGSPELRVRLGEGALRAFKGLPKDEEQIRKQVTEWRSLIDRK